MTVTVMVFALDVFLPSEVAIWVLYMLPLGLTRWSSIGQLTFILSGACTVLVVLGHLYSPPGTAPDVAMVNRGLVFSWCGSPRFSEVRESLDNLGGVPE
jgi:hypothetical protein